jgi:hypothetical protein
MKFCKNLHILNIFEILTLTIYNFLTNKDIYIL